MLPLLTIAVIVVAVLWFFVARRRERLGVATVTYSGDFAIEVVGESHYQDALADICGGITAEGHDRVEEALLVPEDSNPHDKNAVRVEIDGKLVGYLSRHNARELRGRLREAGMPGKVIRVRARIRGGWDRGDGDSGSFGVRIDLPVG